MSHEDALSSVFDRTESVAPRIHATSYNLLIGAVILWGLAVNWLLVAHIDVADLRRIPVWLFVLGYFVSAFGGIYVFASSSRPAVSFLGYNMVVVPVGLVVNLAVARHEPGVVVRALEITLLVTAVMTTVGVLFPAAFENLRGILFIALSVVVLAGARGRWIDAFGALVFSGYIAFDWARAQRIPKTVDNAVDSAAAIYVDIIALFLRVLRLMDRAQAARRG